MPEHKLDKCRSCNAPIIWAQTARGRDQPVDAAPAAGGNLRLQARPGLPPLVSVVAPRLRFGLKLRLPHHATCPQRDQWKRGRSRG